MVLSLSDHKAMLAGFQAAGFVALQEPTAPHNPVRIDWHLDGKLHRFRLWSFDITHGGGGAAVRAADEFRIQITNGPAKAADFDTGGATDLLMGYSRDRDIIVAYDRRWLENWSQKKDSTGSGGSPSVQVKEADMMAGQSEGYHHLKKDVGFGEADIVTMTPAMLPAYLLNHTAVLGGSMTAQQAQSTIPGLSNAGLVEYCASQQFPFEPDLLARYVAAFLTKPLVILAGVSGTGKSKLAELVAEFYTQGAGPAAIPSAPASGDTFVFASGKGSPDRARFSLVAVRPDWIDNQSIVGFVNPITGKYESTQALDLMLRANRALAQSPDKDSAPRYFMLLDEMNLARVEHYFSDWLSCAESRRYRPDGSIMQQPVPLHRSPDPLNTSLVRPDGSTEEIAVPPLLDLPTNLIVTGTVNVDETTFGFSPKVLDRAMVLEFDEVNLDRLRAGAASVTGAGYTFPDTLAPFRLPAPEDYAKLPAKAHEHLVAINGILEEARLHFGYRAANEIALFMRIYNGIIPADAADTDWLRALDAAVLQKVLPRIQGNRAKLEQPLARLCIYLRDLKRATGDLAAEASDTTAVTHLPRSYERCHEMLETLRDFGFVTFFK